MTANISTFRGIMSGTVEELARESVGMAIDTSQRGRRKPVFFTSSNELQNYRLSSAMPELKPRKHSRFEVRHNLGLSEDASPRSDVLIPRVARDPGPTSRTSLFVKHQCRSSIHIVHFRCAKIP